MGRYNQLIFIAFIGVFLSCKKQADVDPEIAVQNVYITSVKASQIDITYELSHLGYQETGVSYYKMSQPTNTTTIQAIRENDLLKLSLQDLEPETEYGFKVTYKQSNEQKTDTKEYIVKTLSATAAAFALGIKDTTITFDEHGNFSLAIEGENLNNLNLSELGITVNGKPVTFTYPTLITGNKYQFNIKGVVDPVNRTYGIQASYQEKQILSQSLPFVFEGDSYWLTYKETNLSGYYASVVNNSLYYFYDQKAFKWDESDQRMVPQGAAIVGLSAVGTEFDGQLFFPPGEQTEQLDPKDFSDFYRYPEGSSYTPSTGSWKIFSFKDQNYGKEPRVIQNSNYFVHKGELYVTYSIANDPYSYNNLPILVDNYVHHYNKSTRQFEAPVKLKTSILDYHLISVNNQLYLLGRVPIYDQGFALNATFSVFKVSDNFGLETVYTGGTVNQSLEFTPENVVLYDNKILIAATLDDFKIFDPADHKLYEVYLKNSISHQYLGGFFTYNNKLHLNADLLFYSQKVYELSITKEH